MAPEYSLYLILLAFFILCFYSNFAFYDNGFFNYWLNEQNKRSRTLKTVIYAATKFFGEPIRDGVFLSGCSEEVQKQCTISSDPADFPISKAVVFHARDLRNMGFFKRLQLNKLTKKRRLDVPFVLWTLESPTNEHLELEKDFINWTMSYKTDSDIFMPYGITLPKTNGSKNLKLDEIWPMKKKEGIWLASNCQTKNRRMELITKIKEQGMDIDIVGKCGAEITSCPRSGRKTKNCEMELMKPYKFVVVIENSNCLDYVTEKFWKALSDQTLSIPIVLSRSYYRTLGIPDSAYIAINDFATIPDFVKFIKNVSNSEEKYMSYHRWRENYRVVNTLDKEELRSLSPINYGFCQLCKKLRGPRPLESKWLDVQKWHSEKKECDNSEADRFLL